MPLAIFGRAANLSRAAAGLTSGLPRVAWGHCRDASTTLICGCGRLASQPHPSQALASSAGAYFFLRSSHELPNRNSWEDFLTGK